LTNLLNNAARYTDAGGHIGISARRDDSGVSISVRDDGIGIPPEKLPHIFEMFEQVHRGAGRSQGGLGIGLTMARSLVEMHGGSVEASSAGPGQGSEFIVRLPLQDATPARPVPDASLAAPASAPLTGQRILVVDDNHDAADTLAMLLAAQGAAAPVAYDGSAALAALKTIHPHVMLLDLGMPGMDGYEVAQHIRRDRRFDSMLIIALTGWGQQGDLLRSKASGIDHHLIKPVDLNALKALLAGS
jgi:CheY-like chemotaxis protein